MYWGASLEFQTPLFFCAQGNRGQGRGLHRRRLAVEIHRPTDWLPPLPGATGEVLTASQNSMFINSSAGVGLLWASPFGPLRFDFAVPITKQPFDRKQWFRFGGGTDVLTSAAGHATVEFT